MKAPENQNEVINLFSQGSDLLENNLSGLNDEELDYVPKNGGWTIRQIIHHITDGDDLWKAAIKIVLGNEDAEFNLKWYLAMPQTEWGKCWNYEKRSVTASLNLFKANREHILQLLEFSANSWTKNIKYQEPDGKIELIPIGFVIEMQANHVVHHVKRIVEIRNEKSN